jgi:LysM repeat protein
VLKLLSQTQFLPPAAEERQTAKTDKISKRFLTKTSIHKRNAAMRLLLLSAFCIFTLSNLKAQTPVYLLFSWDCMDQLEYRATYGGSGVLVYNVHPKLNEQYLLTASSETIKSATMPAGTVACRDFTMNDAFVDAINNGTRPVYMVHQTSNDYILTRIESATFVGRNGSIYRFYMTEAAFAVDTNNLIYGQNLVLPGTDAFVYFSGHRLNQCRFQYTFHREPGRSNLKKSDLEFLPGIGFVSERSGRNNAELENRQLQLVKFNGNLLDDYLDAGCKGRVPQSSISRWVGSTTYGPSYAEPNKEVYPQKTDESSGKYNTAPPATAAQPCKEPYAAGYHIVQRGESMASIARAYQVEMKELAKVNKITNANKVEVCHKLKLPATAKGAAVYNAGTGPVAKNQSEYWGDQSMRPIESNYVNPEKPSSAVPPVTYSNVPPATYSGGSRKQIHVVQLYAIAKKEGVSEARLRELNNLPPLMDVKIYPGQELRLTEDAPVKITPESPATQGIYDTRGNNQQNQNQGLYNNDPRSGQVPAQYNNNYQQPVQSTWQQPVQDNNPAQSATGRPFLETPIGENYQPGPGMASRDIPPPANAPTLEPARQTTYFREYIVQQGDTIGSISAKYNVARQEIALANGKEMNESLVPGQRILVPQQK